MTFAERLPRWTPSRWNLPLDRTLLADLEQQVARAGIWGPGPQWEITSANVTTLADMIHAWVGWGRLKVTASVEESYATTGQPVFVRDLVEYIRTIDHLGIVTPDFMRHIADHQWLAADLYSIIDVLELTAFVPTSTAPKLRILEVGGGWGRLAEMMLALFPGKIEYVMVDAVPVSLVCADAYLRHAFPNLEIGSSARGDSYEPGAYDLYFVPSWDVDRLGSSRFDVVVNIESFQEMTQDRVDLYLSWFDLMLADHGIAYLANSRDYVFKGNWNYPTSWRTLARHRTPRSWTADNSTHVLQKSVGNFSAANMVIDAAYARTIPGIAKTPVISVAA